MATDLPVCPKCGWHVLMNHERICWPVAGAAADALIAAVNLPATKLGYGEHRVTFNLGRPDEPEHQASITLSVSEDGKEFSVEHMQLLDDMDKDYAAKLVRALFLVRPLPPDEEAARGARLRRHTLLGQLIGSE